MNQDTVNICRGGQNEIAVQQEEERKQERKKERKKAEEERSAPSIRIVQICNVGVKTGFTKGKCLQVVLRLSLNVRKICFKLVVHKRKVLAQ